MAGKRVLLVEDLTTDGGSKFRFIDAIRAAEGECAHTFVLFFYDIFEQTRPALAAHGVSLHALPPRHEWARRGRDGGARGGRRARPGRLRQLRR